MQLPLVIQSLTGTITFTGLYSFEFVDKKRNTITEIFFMIPPKRKDVSEGTRATVNPTLSGNFITDAGNSIKSITLSGELYFPYVGSPDNPVARDNSTLQNTIDGLTEFFKLRWMLMRYRDYTLTTDARVDIPSSIMNASPEIATLYRKISKLVRQKLGALYDEVQVIFHDYDMDDHFYCRVSNFSSSQTDAKYLAAEYTINLECYQRDNRQTAQTVEIKKNLNESTDIINSQIQNLNFESSFSEIQTQIGYNTNFYSAANDILSLLSSINNENTAVQAGTKTALDALPGLLTNLINRLETIQKLFLNIFLTDEQRTTYDNGTLTIDDVVDIDLFSFFNVVSKIKIYCEGLIGIINSTVKKDKIRYYANADDYTLTAEQFDENGANKILNESTFKYYTVQEGDTPRIIALRELHDPEKFISILKINSITESDFIDGSLIGKKILIPIDVSVMSRFDNNLVYEADDSDLNKFVHGSDIQLDINRRMMISAKGDILGQSGIQVTYDSILNRINAKKGTLNVFSPNWGLIPIGDGNSPLMVKVSRYLTDLINQIQSDPRVESVKLDMKKLKLEGEALYSHGEINFMGDETREFTV